MFPTERVSYREGAMLSYTPFAYPIDLILEGKQGGQ